MKLVISPEESARLDAAASDPVGMLMDRAGAGVAVVAGAMGAGYGTRVSVLAGTGNNGGDGWVAARHLARRGAAVTVHRLGAPRSDAARDAATAALLAGVETADIDDVVPADLVVDALFGVGFRGDLPDAVRRWSDLGLPVLAVDVPSGLDAAGGTAAPGTFTARRTVTFHALKPGHLLGDGPQRCGPVDVVDIGLVGGTPEFIVADDDDCPRPVRSRTAHKWSAGSVIVVGGTPGITGAAMLAARSALAAGAGSVAVSCPGAIESVYAAMGPGVMTRGVGHGHRFSAGDAAAVLEVASRFDVMVLGPGLGAGTEGFVSALLARWAKPLLIDADGLTALDGAGALADRPAPTILTPHAGEFRRLTGVEAGLAPATDLAAEAGVTVLLKGAPTFVVGAERWAVTSGGPELATIGTGDVLAGTVAALWARGLPAEVAARSGAHWHGRAGAALAAATTVTAEGLAAEIGRWAG
jgi:ADP-dependent NAD(P)H-hydrate dehydratase / NAD(P)H-hydrate epimerase